MFSFKKLSENKKRPLVMGILNITPDSFSDGGEYSSLSKAMERIEALCNEGADIIDIGACSTAPMSMIASEEEELARLSILPQLIEKSTVPVSVDTFRPRVAEFALKCGATIINDESGEFSVEMASVVKAFGSGWIFMHTGGKSSAENSVYPIGVTDDVLSFFARMKKQATNYGINEDCLCYDCGIGFGKSRNDDVNLLSDCKKLSEYSPLLVGVSRKRVIGEIVSRQEPSERINGSIAAAAVAAYSGADILRVHDVSATVDAVKIASTIKKGCL